MSRMVVCAKLKTELEALERAPYPGELGQRIYQEISKQAWQQWQAQQIMLINEYRLNMLDAKAREFLETEMEKFCFGEGSEMPEGYTPPEK